MLALIRDLVRTGFRRVIVVSEGRAGKTADIFEACARMGCQVGIYDAKEDAHPLQTGLKLQLLAYPDTEAAITVDGWGRHSVEEVEQVSELLEENTGEMILGVRDLSRREDKWNAKLGRWLMSLSFRLNAKKSCADLCSGLRGIPAAMFPLILQEEKTGLSYELELQQTCAKQFGLKTFRMADRCRPEREPAGGAQLIAAVLLFWHLICYTSASIISSILDLVLFWVFLQFMQGRVAGAILIATILARCCSGLVNYLINRRFSFESRKAVGGEITKYAIVIVLKTILSGQLVTWLNFLPIPTVLLKAFVDIFLFFINYLAQKYWVFAPAGEEEKTEVQNEV